MKYSKILLISTMLLNIGYSNNCGDLNNDGSYNVLDIVGLANCVLSENCNNLVLEHCGDMNGDGTLDVLDIVLLANCVSTASC